MDVKLAFLLRDFWPPSHVAEHSVQEAHSPWHGTELREADLKRPTKQVIHILEVCEWCTLSLYYIFWEHHTLAELLKCQKTEVPKPFTVWSGSRTKVATLWWWILAVCSWIASQIHILDDIRLLDCIVTVPGSAGQCSISDRLVAFRRRHSHTHQF